MSIRKRFCDWHTKQCTSGGPSRLQILRVCILPLALLGACQDETAKTENVMSKASDTLHALFTGPTNTSQTQKLAGLGRNCTYQNKWNAVVKFEDTDIPASVSLTENEVCAMGRSLIERTSASFLVEINQRCIKQGQKNGCASLTSDDPTLKQVLDDTILTIYSVGTFHDGGKRCLGYVSKAALGSPVVYEYWNLWDSTDCSTLDSYYYSMPRPEGSTLAGLGDHYRSAFKYDGSLPATVLENGQPVLFATSPEIPSDSLRIEGEELPFRKVSLNQIAEHLLGKWQCYNGYSYEYRHDGTYTQWRPEDPDSVWGVLLFWDPTAVQTLKFVYTVHNDRLDNEMTDADTPAATRILEFLGNSDPGFKPGMKASYRLEFTRDDVLTIKSIADATGRFSEVCRRDGPKNKPPASDSASIVTVSPANTTETAETSVTPNDDVVQTRYGKLEVKNIGEFEKGIVLGTDVLFKREDGYLNLEQVIQIGTSDAVLVRNSEGGSGTIDSHFFITLTPGVPPRLSEEFMAQGSAIEPVQKGEQILVDLGYNEGLHETLTYQDAQISIQKSAASGSADEDDCNYLYNEIYVNYVQRSHTDKAICTDPPEEVSGQATARSYFSLSNDPRLNLNEFQNIAKSSCQKGDWIKYSEFKQKVCGVASSTPGTGVVGETPAPAQPVSSGEAKPLATNLTSLRSPPAQSGTANTLINDMIAMSIENNNEKLVELRDRILAQTKPLRGDRKKARRLNDQGLGYFKAEQYAEAAQFFQQATQLDPSDVEIVNNLGYALLEEGRLQEASEALRKALLISPDRTPAWTNLGQVYAMMDQNQQAVACFTNAYRFSKNTDKTKEFLRNLAQNDTDQNVREVAAQAVALM